MITSLANFRSDLNIVKIPFGNFLNDRDTLYVNINLLRLGCSGRTALTLDPPRWGAFPDGMLDLTHIYLARWFRRDFVNFTLFP